MIGFVFWLIYLLSYFSIPLGYLLRLLDRVFYIKALRRFYDLFSTFYDVFTLNLPHYYETCMLVVRLTKPASNDLVLDVHVALGLSPS